jgi:hypothetical protein
MARARPRRVAVKFQSGSVKAVPETRFPAAVAGEQYARYAKSVWTQAHQWLNAHWAHAAQTAASALDARQKLRAIAATNVNRHLYPQEEQLLSEIVHAAWNAAAPATDVSTEQSRMPS